MQFHAKEIKLKFSLFCYSVIMFNCLIVKKAIFSFIIELSLAFKVFLLFL